MPAHNSLLHWLAAVVCAFLLSACATAPPEAPSTQLARLMADSDEAYLTRNPISALYRGDLRFAEQHGDYLSDEYIDAERVAARADLQRLATIDLVDLSEADRLPTTRFAGSAIPFCAGSHREFVLLRFGLPIAHYGGWHLDFAQLSSGEGIARYANVADYEAGLARFEGFVIWLDRARERMRQAADVGVVLPRFVVERMIPQFQALIDAGVDRSMFYGPVRKLPAGFAEVERERIAHSYATAIRERLIPAFERMRDFLAREYLLRSRDSVGLSQVPGGEARYRQLVAQHTTTDLSPRGNSPHRIGRGRAHHAEHGVDQGRSRLSGHAAGVFRASADRPAFQSGFASGARRWLPGDRTARRRGNPATVRRIGRWHHWISVRRRARRTRQMLRQSMTSARRTGAAPESSTYNTYDLPSRPTRNMETLYLHEAVPGHHFQLSLAQENAALPSCCGSTATRRSRRAGRCTPKASGGARLVHRPVPARGRTTMTRSGARCGWSSTPGCTRWAGRASRRSTTCWRNSATSRTDATAEVERYIVDPGQALAYKIGQLTISRLRAQAQTALGARFDVRDFHDQVLLTGALPLTVLEAKIERWIARGGGR